MGRLLSSWANHPETMNEPRSVNLKTWRHKFSFSFYRYCVPLTARLTQESICLYNSLNLSTTIKFYRVWSTHVASHFIHGLCVGLDEGEKTLTRRIKKKIDFQQPFSCVSLELSNDVHVWFTSTTRLSQGQPWELRFLAKVMVHVSGRGKLQNWHCCRMQALRWCVLLAVWWTPSASVTSSSPEHKVSVKCQQFPPTNR